MIVSERENRQVAINISDLIAISDLKKSLVQIKYERGIISVGDERLELPTPSV